MNRLPLGFTALVAVVALSAISCEDDDETTDQGPCVPLTCQDDDRECGAMSDGCGSLISCGACPDGSRCIHGTCWEQCVPDCQDKCSGSDGCGGACSDQCALTGRTCDSAARTCIGDCVPRTCHGMGLECGTWDDWCGGKVTCGDCLPGSNCESGICSSIAGDGLGVQCAADPEICQDPFPDCIKLIGEPAFCSRECAGDGQCGNMGVDDDGNELINCCVPTDGVGKCMPNGMQYLCPDPTDPSMCALGETCLPSPLGSCLFCFEEGTYTIGQECEGFNSCTKTLSCIKPAGEDTATCHQICDPTDGDSCLGGTTARHCVAQTELGVYGVCEDGPAKCLPSKLGADCPTGWNCVPTGSGCTAFECAETAGKQVGESCAEYGDCARGGVCVDGTCREMCSTSDGCPDTYDCVQGCSTKVRYCTPVGGNACVPGAATNTCLAQQTCVPTSLVSCTAGTCVQSGSTASGSSCSEHSDCTVGAMCYQDYCRRICTLTQACTLPDLCTFVCSSVDIGLCMAS